MKTISKVQLRLMGSVDAAAGFWNKASIKAFARGKVKKPVQENLTVTNVLQQEKRTQGAILIFDVVEPLTGKSSGATYPARGAQTGGAVSPDGFGATKADS